MVLIMALLLRIFFYLLYHPLAWMYDWVAAFVSVGMWQDWVYTSLKFVKGSQILELGYGPGHLQQKLLLQGCAPTGIEESIQMGRLAKRNILKTANGYAKPARLVRARAQAIPFPSNTFSTIISTFPTPYIYHDETLHEIDRTLVPGGRLVIVLSGWITGSSFRHRLAASLFTLTGESKGWDPSLAAFFTRAGFTTRVERVTLPDSYVWVLLANKPGQLSPDE